MAWSGEKEILIDRFDGRAHLDFIPPLRKEDATESEKITEEDRQINYERYRVLAQNEFLGIAEESFLKQIHIEEQFGNNDKNENDKNKKKNSQASAAIAYSYEDSSPASVPFSQQILSIEATTSSSTRYEEYAKEHSDDSEIDMDLTVDVKKIGTQQAHELNNYGKKYGMNTNDLFSFLTRDEDEKLSLKVMKEQEADKILSGGRKSRRERRSQREKRTIGRPLNSPPSYAAKEEEKPQEDEEEDDEESGKSSRGSKSPSQEKITYITSFGGEEELQPHSKISIPFKKTISKNLGNLRRNESFADLVRQNAEKLKQINDHEKHKGDSRRSRSSDCRRRRRSSRSSSRHRRSSRSRSNSRRRRYKLKSRSRSRSRRRGYLSSRSRSRRRYRHRSSRSYSRSSFSSRERRRSRSRSRRRFPNRRSRSRSYRRRSYTRSMSRHRSTSREKSLKKSVSRKRSDSRKKSLSQKVSASRDRKRSSSSSSTTTTSSTTSSSSSSSKSSPEKQPLKKSLSREKSLEKSTIIEKRSRSASIHKEVPVVEPTTTTVATEVSQPTIKRYYGRKRDNDSSSSISVDSEDNDDDDKKIGSNER